MREEKNEHSKKRKLENDPINLVSSSKSSDDNYITPNKIKYETPIDLNHLNKEEYSTIFSSATHFGMNKSSLKTTPSISNSLKRNLDQTALYLQNNPITLQKSNSVPHNIKNSNQIYNPIQDRIDHNRKHNNNGGINTSNNNNKFIINNKITNNLQNNVNNNLKINQQNSSQEEIYFDDLHEYDIHGEIGYGTFSTVYKAKCKGSGEVVAIKRIIPTCKPSRVLSEIDFIRKLSGKTNIVQLLGGTRKNYQISLILSFLENDNFKDFKEVATPAHIREYMKGLFVALYHVHENGIIHRDIKPSNFLSNIQKKKFLLVDFGLAQCVDDIKLKSSNSVPSRAGTRGFRAPEVLLKCVEQTTAIDVWSAGVILLSLMTKRYPFFQSPDDLTSLVEISNLCGSKKIILVADKLGKELTLPSEFPEIPWRELITKLNPSFVPDENMLDFLSKLLDIDPSKRVTAKSCLKHPFLKG